MKPIVSGTVSALPLLDLPTSATTEVAKKNVLLRDDPLERSYIDLANGPRKAWFGTDTQVAKAMVTSATLSLEGVIRDLEHWSQERGISSLSKLIRGLEHANEEMAELSASRDVQIERWGLSEVGINILQGSLFRELSELRARFGELLEAVGRSGLEEQARDFVVGTAAAKQAKALFTQLSKLLTEGQVVESHVLWHLRPEGEGLTSMFTVFPAAGGPVDENFKDAYRKHLDAENLLASGKYPEAIASLVASANRLPSTSANLGHALVYLADALVLTGLEKKPIQHLPPGGLDAGALYHAGVMLVRSHVKPDDPDLGRLVAHVHAQLQDTERYELATQITRAALGAAKVDVPNTHLLLGNR